MKPFNLDEYLKNPNKKIVTRDERNVRIICTNKKSMQDYTVVALIDNSDDSSKDTEAAAIYTSEGRIDVNYANKNDLFFASEKREVWVNIYKLGDKFIADEITYNTKEEALHNKDSIMNHVGTFKLEFEEE